MTDVPAIIAEALAAARKRMESARDEKRELLAKLGAQRDALNESIGLLEADVAGVEADISTLDAAKPVVFKR